MKKREKLLLILFGLIIGVLGTSFVYFAKGVVDGISNWGTPEVCFDSLAMERIKNHFDIPEDVVDPYYYQDGFQDHTIYLSFSADKNIVEDLISKKMGFPVNEMSEWEKPQTEKLYIGVTARYGKEYQTPYYNLKTIRKGLVHNNDEAHTGWKIIYDTENHRVYYSWWNF